MQALELSNAEVNAVEGEKGKEEKTNVKTRGRRRRFQNKRSCSKSWSLNKRNNLLKLPVGAIFVHFFAPNG